MKPFFPKFILIVFLINGIKSSSAQQIVLDAPGIAQIDKSRAFVTKSIAEAEGMNKLQKTQLQQSLKRQMDIFFQLPSTKSPIGYNIGCVFSKDAPGRFSDLIRPTAQTFYTFAYLIRDSKTGLIRKPSGSYSYINIQINGLEQFFRQYGNYWKACSDLKLPLFFEQIPLTDSTADYIEIGSHSKTDIYSIYNEPIRFIRPDNRPIFVPLSRKEFVRFVLAAAISRQKGERDAAKQSEQGIIELHKLAANATTKEDRDTYKNGIEPMEKDVAAIKQNIANYQKETQKCQNMLAAMSAQEAMAPARFDPDRKDLGFYDLEQLLPYGSLKGKQLMKINPGYYDLSPGAATVQLLIVSYMIPYSGITAPSFLGKKTVDVYQNLDYHLLKESLQ